MLLDELTLGLSPKAVKNIFITMKQIVKQIGMTILIVEQNVRAVLEIAGRSYAMRLGKVVMEDTPANLTHERSKAAFLGT